MLVVGSPSLDILHFGGRMERAAGGAGLYTALAARRAGARVTMIAPRPDPIPHLLAEAADLVDWRGPVVSPDTLPRFEIAHEPGGRTTYLEAVWGSEELLLPEHIPSDLEPRIAYVVPMIESGRQLELVSHLHGRGIRIACGTYPGAAREHRNTVLAALELADIFFCNEEEGRALFGDLERAATRAGRLLYITLGERGALVLQGDHGTHVEGVGVRELDPTGAGDTFCGTALARLALDAHPVVGARHAVAAAAEMVTGVGPEKLLLPPPAPEPPADPRLRLEPDRVAALARILADAPEAHPFDFTGPDFPEPGHPGTLDFFFAATLQQFGFWSLEGEEGEGTASAASVPRYGRPMIAGLDGRPLKGSDFLWAAYRRWLEEAPEELAPEGQARLDPPTLDRRLRDDSGRDPLPAADLHLRAANGYGVDMTRLGWTPSSVLERARADGRPLTRLLTLLDHVGGYKEDPLRKKSALLGLILSQRPERFLTPSREEDAPPIVDYHAQRACLRLGLVTIGDPGLESRIRERLLLEPEDERAVRRACHEAVGRLHELSDRPMGAVDWFLFQMRRRCPEMTDPDCPACPADPICAHRTGLFQPVFRTDAY